jgi:hypothetical protein
VNLGGRQASCKRPEDEKLAVCGFFNNQHFHSRACSLWKSRACPPQPGSLPGTSRDCSNRVRARPCVQPSGLDDLRHTSTLSNADTSGARHLTCPFVPRPVPGTSRVRSSAVRLQGGRVAGRPLEFLILQLDITLITVQAIFARIRRRSPSRARRSRPSSRSWRLVRGLARHRSCTRTRARHRRAGRAAAARACHDAG